MRQDAKLTQRQLALELRVTHVWVHKSEIGDRRVDVAEFMDWCIACGVEPDEGFSDLRRQRGV